jgi:hypothetical protein
MIEAVDTEEMEPLVLLLHWKYVTKSYKAIVLIYIRSFLSLIFFLNFPKLI